MRRLDKNIKQKTPILFGLKKEHILKVPYGYFDELPSKLMQIANIESPKIIQFNKWIVYTSTIAAIFIIGFFSLQQINQLQNKIFFNEEFNNLTVLNFEQELVTTDDLSIAINFDDEEELEFMMTELEKPFKKMTLYSEDFYNFFESDIEYIY